MKKRISGTNSLILRFLFAALIIYLLTLGKKKLILQTIHTTDPVWLIAAFMCFFLSFLVCVARWHSLLKMQDIDLSLTETFVLSMQGMFFSLVIPGAVGGDLAKAGFVSAKAGAGSKVKAVFSILIDRVIGLMGLFVLAGILGIVSYSQIAKLSNSAKMIVTILVAGSITGIAGASVLFFHRKLEKLTPIKYLLELANKYGKSMPTLLMEALDGYRASYVKLITWIITSAIFVHSLQGFAVYCMVIGVGHSEQQVQYVVLSASMGNAVGAIPLTPSGFGTRDAVIAALLSASGIEYKTAWSIALMNTGLIIIFNLIGGIFFITGGRKKQSPQTS
ncbi:MAG TPA: lysylphosphatidylglycerol synthase transmembrane domain-containing protein [Victivallales bacterium]|nr:lysylphosphatidylglycerol synthase transmembrane domain-containing protein [Victivallales bacterium]